MSLTQFIRDNRAELDQAIRGVCPGYRPSDQERRLWVLNDEGLYNWAQSAGVKL